MVTFGISTWSIHRELERGDRDLLDVPAAIREHGMTDLQICHFHVKSQEKGHLADLRKRVEASDVTLDAMLLDFGDISHPTNSGKDVGQLETWLAIAGELGARHARISAGSQKPTEETLKRAADNLIRLSDVGQRNSVKVVTENWHAMMPSSAEVNRVFDLTARRVPLCLDFGNWSGSGKYDELAAVAAHAATVHAKCSFDAVGVPDAEDFRRCLGILKSSDYDGTIALIYDAPSPDEWKAIDIELSLAREVFPS